MAAWEPKFGFSVLESLFQQHPGQVEDLTYHCRFAAHGTHMMKAIASPLLLVILAAAGCADERVRPNPANASEKRADRLVFPEAVAADDRAVNQIVRDAMMACLDDDYDRFRGLWSATEEPLKRKQFERQWQPVRRISIRKIQPMRHARNERLLYYVHAGFEFGVGARRPESDAVFLIVRENDTWRLARAPKSLVKQVRQKSTDDEQS